MSKRLRASAQSGPSLDTYVETRFNLLNESIKEYRAFAELRELERIDAVARRLDASIAATALSLHTAMESSERALLKVEAATERRFQSVNEFRATLSDQATHFIQRSEVEVMRVNMGDRVTELKETIDRLQAERLGIKGGWGYAVGGLGFVLALISLLAWVLKIGGDISAP